MILGLVQDFETIQGSINSVLVRVTGVETDRASPSFDKAKFEGLRKRIARLLEGYSVDLANADAGS